MTAKTWIFEPSKNTWTEGPALKQKRYLHGCFTVKDKNQIINEIYVTGGHCNGCGGQLASTEQLSLNGPTDDWEWSNSQNLPHGIMNINAAVESREGEYMGYNVGGYKDKIVDTVYGLRKTDNGLVWEELSKLKLPTYYHSVVNAPASIIPSC